MARQAADALAAVTARAAQAPTAMVHLLDGEAVRLVGGWGLPPGWTVLRRVPLHSTLAGMVIHNGVPLIVSDTDTDTRVPADASIRAAGIRAYAGFPVRDPDDNVVGVCAVMDSTARPWSTQQLTGVQDGARACTAFVAEQRTAAAADAAHRFLDALLHSLQVGVAACDQDGRIVFSNETMRRLSGDDGNVNVHTWAQQGRLDDDTGHALPANETPMLRALRGERLRNVEISVAVPAGPRPVVLVDAKPISGPDGRTLGAVVAAHDVTELRRAERFREVELAVARVLASSADVHSAAEPILRSICLALGWPHGQLWLADLEADLLRRVAVHDESGRASTVHVPAELRRGQELAGRAWQAGEAVWVRDLSADTALPAAIVGAARSAVALPVPSGETTLAVLVFIAEVVDDPEDLLITLLQGVAAQIAQFLQRRRAQELALALARTSDEYLSLVGHEMRTPLTSIAAYTSLLRELDDTQIGADARELLAAVERNSDQLRHIIDELLDLSALASGHAPIACQPVNLTAVVDDAVAAHRQQAPSNVAIRADVDAACTVTGDAGRLRQVVDTLLSNAMLHSFEGGTVTVTLSREGSNAAHLTVADTGIGIPDDEREQLFTRFYRSSRTREHRIPGAGLALAISRAILERHHGSIHVLPHPEPGTCIQVRLPVEPC